MKATTYDFPGVILFQPRIFEDHRGLFTELYHQQKYREVGLDVDFVQDNFSRSKKHTLRGLHYQLPQAQGKLIAVLSGAIVDVIVDLRRSSPTFKQHLTFELDSSHRHQLYVPPGFAHGFCVTSDFADVLYKCTALHAPPHEHILQWDDPELNIVWPTTSPDLSPRDRQGKPLRDAILFD